MEKFPGEWNHHSFHPSPSGLGGSGVDHSHVVRRAAQAFQWLLGVATVVSGINLLLAVLHQVNACLLLGCFVFTLQSMRVPKK